MRCLFAGVTVVLIVCCSRMEYIFVAGLCLVDGSVSLAEVNVILGWIVACRSVWF